MKRPASLLRTVVPRATLFLAVGSHFRTPSANLIYQRCIVASKSFATMAAATGAPLKTALIIGGNGALGQGVVNTFKNAGWSTISADVTVNAAADSCIALSTLDSWEKQVEHVKTQLISHGKLGAIICTAGGWAGGAANSDKLVESVTQMHTVCLQPALTAAHVATSGSLAEGGVLVLTGSEAALHPTPSMIGYGLAKAATHHLTLTLAAKDSGMPPNSRVICVLPKVIDTPSNRKWMAGPGVDTSSWTPPEHIAAACLGWCSSSLAASQAAGAAQLPPSGSLAVVDTKAGKTEFKFVRVVEPQLQ